LPGDVYGSSPFLKSGRNKQHVVWDDVKFLKKHTAQGTTVHEKYRTLIKFLAHQQDQSCRYPRPLPLCHTHEVGDSGIHC
jgi:hypothetical protein